MNIYENKGKRHRRRGKKSLIRKMIIPVICIALIAVIGSFVNKYINKNFIEPAQKHEAAVALFDGAKYSEASKAFEELGTYKDSDVFVEKIKHIMAGNADEEVMKKKYDYAMEALEAKDYTAAIALFTALDEYQDSADLLAECKKKSEEWGDIKSASVKQYCVLENQKEVYDIKFKGVPGFIINFDKVKRASGYQIFGLVGNKMSELKTTNDTEFYYFGSDPINYLVVRAYRESKYGDTMYGEWRYIDLTANKDVQTRVTKADWKKSIGSRKDIGGMILPNLKNQ